ncbi:MAG TPA: hypothetical protein VJH37_05055 [Candidatus Nanoarchaeia archaeon]|nr:hypothetical protein [Candidatus Nanoarchaeia archaeon]
MGLLKKIIKVKFYVGLMGLGYLLHSCISNNQRYRVHYENSRPHLIDTDQHQSLEIHMDSFQVGSATYRLQGLLQDSNLEKAMQDTKQLLEEKQ